MSQAVSGALSLSLSDSGTLIAKKPTASKLRTGTSLGTMADAAVILALSECTMTSSGMREIQ